MNSTSYWNGKLHVPNALRGSHDELRAELVRATMEEGPIAKAADWLAQLCLPHFEREEKYVFPVLGLLPDLTQGIVRPEMEVALALISDFSSRQDALNAQHQLILSAVEALMQAAKREKNREFADLAYGLRAHERIEDEVIYPTVLLIGSFLQEKLVH